MDERPSRKGGEPCSHVGVVGWQPDPVGETPLQYRRRNARLDQEKMGSFESGQSLGIGTLLRPPHHDNIVVMRGRRLRTVRVYHHTIPFTRVVSVRCLVPPEPVPATR